MALITRTSFDNKYDSSALYNSTFIYNNNSDSGRSSSSTTIKKFLVRVITGTGVGTGIAYLNLIDCRTATGSGSATTSSIAIGLVVRLRTALGTGRVGVATRATRLIKSPRSAIGAGISSQSCVSYITIKKQASGSGDGDSVPTNWTKSLIFRNPVDDRFGWTDYEVYSPATRLFAHLEQGYRARNIYRLIDGSYTTNDPGDPAVVEKLYLGGHENFVSETEKAQLIAAGYTVT